MAQNMKMKDCVLRIASAARGIGACRSIPTSVGEPARAEITLDSIRVHPHVCDPG